MNGGAFRSTTRRNKDRSMLAWQIGVMGQVYGH